MVTVIVLILLFGLLLVGIPVAFALGGLGALMLLYRDFSPLMPAAGLLSTIDNFLLLSVPLFLLMSNVLLKGGVGKDLFAGIGPAVWRSRRS